MLPREGLPSWRKKPGGLRRNLAGAADKARGAVDHRLITLVRWPKRLMKRPS
jgi:hypothetical protein